MIRAARLSSSQMHMLRNLVAGRKATAGLTGKSAHGGATQTLVSLHRRGLMENLEITEAGRAMVEAKS